MMPAPGRLILSPTGPVPPPWVERLPGSEACAAVETRVAIVEDEMMVAWALESMVEDMGYEVAGVFANASAALAGLLAAPVALVLMDINLGGGIDGIETARRIRLAYDVPVIFISAYADRATQVRIAEAVPGARFLCKPVQPADLTAAIGAAIGGDRGLPPATPPVRRSA